MFQKARKCKDECQEIDFWGSCNKHGIEMSRDFSAITNIPPSNLFGLDIEIHSRTTGHLECGAGAGAGTINLTECMNVCIGNRNWEAGRQSLWT